MRGRERSFKSTFNIENHSRWRSKSKSKNECRGDGFNIDYAGFAISTTAI